MLEKVIIGSLFDFRIRNVSINLLDAYMFEDDLHKSLLTYFKGLESDFVDDFTTLKLKVSSYYNIDNQDNHHKLETLYLDYLEYRSSDVKEMLNEIEKFLINKKLYHLIKENLRKNNNKLTIDDSMRSNLMESLDSKISVEKTVYNFNDERDLSYLGMDKLENLEVIKSKYNIINSAANFQGFLKGNLVCLAAKSGVGKTFYLLNESCNFLQQGKKVLYFNLGDMQPRSMLLRFLSNLSGASSDDVKTGWMRYYLQHKETLSNLRSVILDAGEFDVRSVLAKAKKLYNSGFEYDVVIFDYDQNFKNLDGSTLYDFFGDVYTKLKAFASDKFLVMTASQIKISEYDEEILGSNCLSDSSKKINQLDWLITLGRNAKNPTVGTMNIAKCRDGRTDVFSRIQFNLGYASIDEIDSEEYEAKKRDASNETKDLFGM